MVVSVLGLFRTRKRQMGVSLLLETLLGLSLVTIALLAVFGLFTVSDRSLVLADRTTKAHHFARRILEENLCKPYESLAVTTGQPELIDLVEQDTVRRGGEIPTNYCYSIRVKELKDALGNSAHLKLITVSVSWREGVANSKRASEVTLQGIKNRQW